MPLERTRRCKVNINFSNFETIAINLFHDPLEIGLRDLRNLGQLIHAVKSAEPLLYRIMAMTLFSPIPTTERKVAESAPLSSINPERTGSGSEKLHKAARDRPPNRRSYSKPENPLRPEDLRKDPDNGQ